jgi:hypothetical protein
MQYFAIQVLLQESHLSALHVVAPVKGLIVLG